MLSDGSYSSSSTCDRDPSMLLNLNPICLLLSDSLSSGDDEDYDDAPEDAGNGNGEVLIILSTPHHTSETIHLIFPATRGR